jgi:hypothetical protein
MSETPEILSAEQMQRRYGSFYNNSPKVYLDRNKVPEACWPLLPYAEFWGIADDSMRGRLVKHAPQDIQLNLKEAVSAFDNPLDEWLTGPEAEDANLSDEFVAFTAMTMAADFI